MRCRARAAAPSCGSRWTRAPCPAGARRRPINKTRPFRSNRRLSFFDRSGNDVAVLGPAAVVILHVVDAEKVFQDEPGVAGAFADPAVGHGGLFGVDPLLLEIDGLQFVSE